MTVIITNNVEYDRNNFCLWKVNALMTVSMLTDQLGVLTSKQNDSNYY